MKSGTFYFAETGNFNFALTVDFFIGPHDQPEWCTKLDDFRTFLPIGFPIEDVRAVLSYDHMQASI